MTQEDIDMFIAYLKGKGEPIQEKNADISLDHVHALRDAGIINIVDGYIVLRESRNIDLARCIQRNITKTWPLFFYFVNDLDSSLPSDRLLDAIRRGKYAHILETLPLIMLTKYNVMDEPAVKQFLNKEV